MKNQNENLVDLANKTYSSIFFQKEDEGVLLSKLKEKLICNNNSTICYSFIHLYRGTRIEDICWEVLNMPKYNRIMVL